MLIRSATPDDLLCLRELEKHAVNAAHWAEREYTALFAPDAPPRIALVAAGESGARQVCGFVITRCALDAWEIENVVVGEQHRQVGIGTQLIQELLLQARTRGATSVLLEVRESNLAARRFYEKLGFSEQGRRKGYYQNPREDALMLQKSIAVP